MTDWRVRLCRGSYAAWAAGDLEGVLELYDPECEWDMGPMAAAGLGPVFEGHAGLRRLFADLTGAFPEGFAPRIMELRLLGDQLLVRGDAIGTSELVQVETTTAPYGQIIDFKDGRIRKVSQTDDPPPDWDKANAVA